MKTTYYLPDNLKKMPIWILWKLEEDDKGRKTKVPYSANYNGRASSTNPNTWSSFETALSKFNSCSEEYAGLGIMVSKEYRLIFIDIDNCVSNEGILDERATDILGAFQLLQTYAELSQSGSGIHLLAFGEIPKNFKNPHNGVEMYSEKRFCALTGNALNASEIVENPSAVAFCFNKYRTPEKVQNTHTAHSELSQRSDIWIINKAKQHGGKFALLYAGDWEQAGYTSRSEADSALCSILAFWTDADEIKIDRLFRSSGLYREKWERADYRESTIRNACSHIEETFSEFSARRNREEGRELERVFLSQW